jgi:hypothetical protein
MLLRDYPRAADDGRPRRVASGPSTPIGSMRPTPATRARRSIFYKANVERSLLASFFQLIGIESSRPRSLDLVRAERECPRSQFQAT